jgi:2-C-methyl-D-erythritol 4-phosphate cytidylyltransferase
VALRKSEAASFQKQIEKENFSKPLRIVEGGEHRQNSVANALAAIEAADDDIVLIHDAVRPFVDQETIVNVIEAVKKYDAAIAGVPAIDTVKQVDRTADGAVVIATVPRERMVLAQTPQGFRFGLLKKTFDEALADGFMGTDEASLVERSGRAVHVVMGSPRNMKITTPADLELAEFFLTQENRDASLSG